LGKIYHAGHGKYWDLYDRASFQLPKLRVPPAGAPEFAPTTWGELRQYADIPQVGPLTDAQAVELIHGYHATVSFVDAQIGRVAKPQWRGSSASASGAE